MYLRCALSIFAMSISVMMYGCGSPSPATRGARLDSADAAATALAGFRRDSKASKFFADAYGWAVFPEIVKGALLVGASNGHGEVYRGGALVGYASVTSVTVGAQVGGQSYSEIIFFQDEAAFDRFTSDQFTGQASAGAVAGDSGGLNLVDYNHGVAVFTRNNAGLIVSADIGGQKFQYEAK